MTENFIGRYENVLDAKQCQRLIDLFNASHKRKVTHDGLTGPQVDKKRKDSTDLSAAKIPPKLKEKYAADLDFFFDALVKCHDQYTDDFPILKPPKTWMTGVYDFNIQRYYPGGQAYHAWHYENPYPEVSDRVLAWMCYLSDVDNGGETEFEYYGIKEKPQAGKLLIWPAGFTHSHRGLPAPDEVKFIITGWFQFAPR